jgi:Transposase DDE domain group 1
VRIWLRADSGFARDGLMTWCENNDVAFVFGLAKNDRLNAELAEDLAAAAKESQETGKPARRFKDFTYRTRESWSRERRVIGKAEWMTPAQVEADDAMQRKKKKEHAVTTPDSPGRGNPRFVVTSLSKEEYEARALYEDLYCARGEMENRIKECQLDLFADRTSCNTMRSNQLRLWFASFAYVLVSALRRLGLAGTQFADATCGTIRLKLLKIGAQVKISVRRVLFSMASAFPYVHEFSAACAALR